MFGSHLTDQALFDNYYKENCANGSLLYVGRLLERAAQKYPNNTALIFETSSITYKHLFQRASSLSKHLLAQGIKPRDRVLLFMHNSIDYYIAHFAILQAGAVIVPLNTFLREHELAHILQDAKPAAFIVSSDLEEIVKNADKVPFVITEKFDAFNEPSLENLPVFECIDLDIHEMAALLYTSGTTGVPKGVMLSSNNIMNNILQGVSRLRSESYERVLAILPLFHSFAQAACVWGPVFLGSTVIIVPRIDRRSILEGLRHDPTTFLGVPALFGLLCLMKTAPLSRVKLFASGGDALPDKIRAGFALLYRRKIISGYGLTEASPVISVDFDDEAMPTSNVGRPLAYIECSLRDENGAEVASGAVGELWIKGPNVMLGYYNEPEMTQKVIKDGWLATGDFAYMDEKGRIVITGRLKDLIINKGFNIYPQEIENVIMSHPNVIRVGVVGCKDPMVGEIPVAYVQLKENDPQCEKALKDLCAKNLASYKIPRSFVCSTQELPMTVTGKVDKKVLRLRKHED